MKTFSRHLLPCIESLKQNIKSRSVQIVAMVIFMSAVEMFADNMQKKGKRMSDENQPCMSAVALNIPGPGGRSSGYGDLPNHKTIFISTSQLFCYYYEL